MQERQLLDETFDPQRCGSYQLLLQPGRLGFRLAVHDPLRNQFIAFASLPLQEASEGRWHEAIAKLQVAYPWVASSFRNVRIGWRSHLFTLLPQALFIEAEAKRVLQAMGAFYDCDAIYYNRLTADALMLFTVPGDLVNALQPIQPQFSIIHPDASLHLLALSLFRRSAGLVVHVAEGVVTLILAGQVASLAQFQDPSRNQRPLPYGCAAESSRFNTEYNPLPNGRLPLYHREKHPSRAAARTLGSHRSCAHRAILSPCFRESCHSWA